MIPILGHLSQKIEAEGIIPSSFWNQHYPITKTRQSHYKKKTTDQYLSWTCVQKSQQNIRIQQWVQRYIHHNQVEFITGMQGWFDIQKSINAIYHNQAKELKWNEHIDRCRKSIWQNLKPTTDKTLSKL